MVRLRMWRDLSALWVRENWAILVSALLVAQAILAYISLPAATATGVATLLSIMMFARENWIKRKESRNLVVEQRRDPPAAGLKPPPAWADGVVHEVLGQAHLTSEIADQLVTEGSITFESSRIPHRLPTFVAQLVPSVVAYRRRAGSIVFNGSVLRLDGDPAALQSEETSLTVRPTNYYDALATNYLKGHQVVSRVHRRVITTGWEFAVDRRGFVRDLEQSWSANLVGVSTLAFTTDRQVVLVQQSAGNVSERDRLAPSGSGSAEPADMTQASESLNAVIARAMERELKEECNLPKVPMRTRVLGYSRWLDKGAKPEFYGITALGISERAVLDIDVAGAERLLVSRVRTDALDLAALADIASNGDLPALCALLDGAVSSPLVMCLRALGIALHQEPQILDNMFESLTAHPA